MNRNTKELRAQSKDKNLNLLAGESYSGPLPHPDILKGFQEINPDYPDKIFSMAEENNKANIRAQDRITIANIVIPVIGQIFTFLLGLCGVGAGIFLALQGHSAASIAAILSGLAPIIIAAIQNMKQK